MGVYGYVWLYMIALNPKIIGCVRQISIKKPAKAGFLIYVIIRSL